MARKVVKEDLDDLYDLVWQQFQEDRDEIRSIYKDLKQYLNDDPARYAMSGDTLAKYAELMTKQTAQVLELLKIAHKEKGSDTSLDEDDIAKINDAITSKK